MINSPTDSLPSSFRPFWRGLFSFTPLMGFLLILVFSIPRFYLVLQAILIGNYGSVSWLFIAMSLLPFLLLTRMGRRSIGWKRPNYWTRVAAVFIFGILAASFFYFLGLLLFDLSSSHWFVFIGETYPLPDPIDNSQDRLIFFIIFSAISMTFSPIGEELLYRGMIHQCFVPKWGEKIAGVIDASAFGFVHLAHFGLVHTHGHWIIQWFPAICWVILIFLTGLFFSWSRKYTGSIAGAISSHAGFNLGMTFFIFYLIR